MTALRSLQLHNRMSLIDKQCPLSSGLTLHHSLQTPAQHLKNRSAHCAQLWRIVSDPEAVTSEYMHLFMP